LCRGIGLEEQGGIRPSQETGSCISWAAADCSRARAQLGAGPSGFQFRRSAFDDCCVGELGGMQPSGHPPTEHALLLLLVRVCGFIHRNRRGGPQRFVFLQHNHKPLDFRRLFLLLLLLLLLLLAADERVLLCSACVCLCVVCVRVPCDTTAKTFFVSSRGFIRMFLLRLSRCTCATGTFYLQLFAPHV
jgi:hypothetical protein